MRKAIRGMGLRIPGFVAVVAAAVSAAPLALAAPQRAPLPANGQGQVQLTGSAAEPLVSLEGTDLSLAVILDYLVRAHGLQLTVMPDVNVARAVPNVFLHESGLRDALRSLLTPQGYSFHLEGKSLVVFARETRTFTVRLPAIAQQWFSSVANEASSPGGGGGSGGGGGGSVSASASGGSGSSASGSAGGGLGAQVALSARTDSKGLWTEIEEGLKQLLAADATATFSVSRTAGLVAVTAIPSSMATVEAYIDAINREISRRAEVEVQVVEVSLNDDYATGIDWSAVLGRIGGSTYLPLKAVTPFSTGAIAASENAFSFAIAADRAKVLLRAVEEQGKLHVVAKPTLVVNSSLPSVIQVGSVQSYVSELTVTEISNAGAQLSVKTGVLSDGIILALAPHVNADGSVIMGLSVIMQDIKEIRREPVGAGFVELPQTNRRSYASVNEAKADQTLVIGGLMSTREAQNGRGVPILGKLPLVGLLFRSFEKEHRRLEVVIMLTVRAPATTPPVPPSTERLQQREGPP
jgi:type IVB pilus formation R64 PilN family outer membrane protein